MVELDHISFKLLNSSNINSVTPLIKLASHFLDSLKCYQEPTACSGGMQ